MGRDCLSTGVPPPLAYPKWPTSSAWLAVAVHRSIGAMPPGGIVLSMPATAGADTSAAAVAGVMSARLGVAETHLAAG
jgi:hypothetical protein